MIRFYQWMQTGMYDTSCLAIACFLSCVCAPVIAGSPARVELRGVVPPRCEILTTDNTQSDAGFVLRFDLYCNTAFALTVQSENGALMSNIGGGSADKVGYDLQLLFPDSDRPAEPPVRSEHSSGTAFSGTRAEVDIGPTAFARGGEIHVTLDKYSQRGEPIEYGLRAGEYSDVIAITLAPRD